MPIDEKYLNERQHFWNQVYRFALLGFTIAILVTAIVGVRQVFNISNRLDDRTQAINNHINCVVSLFTQPNRTNLTIDDINHCTLVRK